MESWLLRNVGFYRSFLPFYLSKNIYADNHSDNDSDEDEKVFFYY